MSLQPIGCLGWVAMGAPSGFFDNVIDDAVGEVVLGGERQRIGRGRVGHLIGLFPQNCGAPLGADHRVPGVLEHVHSVGYADPKCAAGATFADDHADDRCLEPTHVSHVYGDGLSLPAFLWTHAGIGTGCIDERDDGKPELLSQFHLGQCLAVALGMGASEVALDSLFCGASFLVADHEHLVGTDAAETGDDRRIVAEAAIAVEFTKVAEERIDVVRRLGPIGVPSDLDHIHRCQTIEDGVEQVFAALPERLDLFGKGIGIIASLQPTDLGIEFDDRSLEGQRGGFGGGGVHETGAMVSMAAGCRILFLHMSAEIGFLGAGHMGRAILEGGLAAGLWCPSGVLVVDHDETRRRDAESLGCMVESEVAALRDVPVVVLCVRPQDFREAVASLRSRQPRLAVSVMAGIESAAIAAACGEQTRVIRAMPNAPAVIGHGMTAIARGEAATDEDVQYAEKMFAGVGRTVQVGEDMMCAVTAVSGSGPAWVYLLAEAIRAEAIALGLPEEIADTLINGMVEGAAAMMSGSDLSPTELVAAVTTPGGTTEAGLATMRAAGFVEAVRGGVAAACQRGEKLAQ